MMGVMMIVRMLGASTWQVDVSVLTSGMVMMKGNDLRLDEKAEECGDNDEDEAARLSSVCVHRPACPLTVPV